MDTDQKRQLSFPLRLPFSMRDIAGELAQQDGISLNHFISLAVAEKISRLEQDATSMHQQADVNSRSAIHSVPRSARALNMEQPQWATTGPGLQKSLR